MSGVARQGSRAPRPAACVGQTASAGQGRPCRQCLGPRLRTQLSYCDSIQVPALLHKDFCLTNRRLCSPGFDRGHEDGPGAPRLVSSALTPPPIEPHVKTQRASPWGGAPSCVEAALGRPGHGPRTHPPSPGAEELSLATAGKKASEERLAPAGEWEAEGALASKGSWGAPGPPSPGDLRQRHKTPAPHSVTGETLLLKLTYKSIHSPV